MGVYANVADLLEYPDERLPERVDACVASLDDRSPAASLLTAFRVEAERLGVARLQELYTAAFDMDADCALYVGHHLLGADARRGLFMACLAAQYRAAGMSAEKELPDYLPAVLRFVERAPDAAADARGDLMDVLPGVARRLADTLGQRQHPYANLLRALARMLES